MLFVLQSCAIGQDTTTVVTAIAPTQMNVLYAGIENPVKVASSGIKAQELEVTVDNGIITGKNGAFIIIPEKAGTAVITVKHKGKEIEKSTFRVRLGINVIPVLQLDSSFYNYKKLGAISRNKFLNAYGINVIAENSDFDLNFQIIEFTLSNSTQKAISNSNTFTDEQKAIIAKAKINSEVYIENVYVKLTDGSTRYLPSMSFTISGE